MRKRKTYDDNFKARVALKAIKRERTISEIAGQFEVHPKQIIKWKKQLLENVSSLFSKKKDPEVEELYKKIGKQNIELEFIKKSTSKSRTCKKAACRKGASGIECKTSVQAISLNRSSLYYERIGLSGEDQRILDEMDKIYLDFPVYGSRRMSRELKRRGFKVGRQRARSLMRILGVEAIYPRKRLSFPDKEHQIYPYLLRDVSIDQPDMAWAADITYIRLKHGFVYLVAVMDLFSRYIVSWWISNTLGDGFLL